MVFRSTNRTGRGERPHWAYHTTTCHHTAVYLHTYWLALALALRTAHRAWPTHGPTTTTTTPTDGYRTGGVERARLLPHAVVGYHYTLLRLKVGTRFAILHTRTTLDHTGNRRYVGHVVCIALATLRRTTPVGQGHSGLSAGFLFHHLRGRWTFPTLHTTYPARQTWAIPVSNPTTAFLPPGFYRFDGSPPTRSDLNRRTHSGRDPTPRGTFAPTHPTTRLAALFSRWFYRDPRLRDDPHLPSRMRYHHHQDYPGRGEPLRIHCCIRTSVPMPLVHM